MKRRSFLAMLGLAPMAGVMAAKVNVPKSEAAARVAADDELKAFLDGIAPDTRGELERYQSDLDTVNIGTLNAGILSNRDGSFVIDLGNSEISWTA
jgi:hypothetical protein